MSFAPGPPLTDTAVRIVLLGSGELGREVAIEALRLGCEVLAVDRYAGAPAMQVAQRHAVIDMTDPDGAARAAAGRARAAVRAAARRARARGDRDARAARARAGGAARRADGSRRPLDDGPRGHPAARAEELGVKTCAYRFCDTEDEVREAVAALGTPCVIKPVMSSSGKGQSVIHDDAEVAATWTYAQEAGRVGAGRVIVEAFVEFDYEITLLTIRHAGGHVVLRADRPPPGARRLPRELAAAPDGAGRARRGARARAAGHRRARRDRDLRGRALRARRRGALQRGLPAPARHRHDDDGDPGAERVRAARARDPRPAGPGRRGPAAVAGRVGRLPGERAGRRAVGRAAWPTPWRSIPASTSACSPSPTRGPTAAWPSRSPAARTLPPHARPRAPPRPASASTEACDDGGVPRGPGGPVRSTAGSVSAGRCGARSGGPGERGCRSGPSTTRGVDAPRGTSARSAGRRRSAGGGGRPR